MSVLVLVETEAGAVLDVSLEALTFARSAGDEVQAVLFADTSEEVLAELGRAGVTTVHAVRGEDFVGYAAAAYAAAVAEVVAKQSATVLLAAGTARGNELLAHVATRTGVAMAANVVELSPGEPLVVSRQVLGGTALEEMRLPDRVAVFTVAGHAVEAAPAETGTTPEVVEHHLSASPADLRARVVRTEEQEVSDTGALTSARVVVGAGRGAGSADGFGDLLELTELVGGALGVSRVVTSLGWRPHHEQVGQTGSRITPDLYIPCGISGAIQHWAGCQSAKTILAINTDAEAPMVTRAHYAVIGDLHEIVPAINEEIRRRRG